MAVGVELGPEDKGKTVEVRRGALMEVCLPENPTTGYRWEVDHADESIVGLEEVVFSRASSVTVGAGGWRTFRFKARATGSARLQLKRWRPWEGSQSIVDRYEVSIRVEG